MNESGLSMEAKTILNEITEGFVGAFVSLDIGKADLSELSEPFIPPAVVIEAVQKRCGHPYLA